MAKEEFGKLGFHEGLSSVNDRSHHGDVKSTEKSAS